MGRGNENERGEAKKKKKKKKNGIYGGIYLKKKIKETIEI